MMIKNVIVSIILIVLSCFIHTLATKYILSKHKRWSKSHSSIRRILRVDIVVLVLVLATLIETMIWAGYYYFWEMFETFEKSIYFSLVTFSTLGYGDVVLPESFRLSAAFEATNGIIIFGWTTALFVSSLQKIYSNT